MNAYTLNLHAMSSHYAVKQFTEEDIANILAMCKGNPDYYKHMHIEPDLDNLKEVLIALPPNKAMCDKLFAGFYKDSQLVAILDLITEHPNKNTAFIGWFMLHKDFQRTGTGTIIIEEVLAYLKSVNFLYVRLGYTKGNPQSERFWLKNKFVPTGIVTKTEHYTVVTMQRAL